MVTTDWRSYARAGGRCSWDYHALVRGLGFWSHLSRRDLVSTRLRGGGSFSGATVRRHLMMERWAAE